MKLPFHDFAKVVGRRHQVEHAAVRDFIIRRSVRPQAPQNGIRMNVHQKADEENDHAADEEGMTQRGVAHGKVVEFENTTGLQIAIVRGEEESQDGSGERSLLAAANQCAVDDGALEVVQHEKTNQDLAVC